MGSFEWRGDAVRERMEKAAALGVDKTMSECVGDARSGHPAYPPASEPGERYANRTGFDTASTDILDPAHSDGTRVHGSWGALSEVALFLEIGTSREGSGMPTASEREEMGGGDMDAIPGPSEPPLMAPRPTLRPASDKHYPGLAEWIGMAFRGEEL